MSDAALRDALTASLGAKVERVVRRPLTYASTFPIEHVEAVLADGTRRPLVFKAFSAVAPPSKPPFLLDPRREIELYERVLPGRDAGAPACYGACADDAAGRYWLFLEAVEGDPLWQAGDFAVWEAAARSLAALHAGGPPPAGVRAIRYDGASFAAWLPRALAATGAAALGPIPDRHGEVVDRLSALPPTLVHGDFYPANVLVEPSGRLRVVDWELGGTGPGLLDLAAFTSGGWPEAKRARLVRAYRGTDGPGDADFDRALLCARLHVALQWLGWSSAWTPPPEHRYDWLAEARRLAEELGW